MGSDDDADCVEHVWVLTEVNLSAGGADQVHTCGRCGTPRYQPGQAALVDRRPPL
jgi:hypothetical protein